MMTLKMKELTALTDTPKSTILYYIKEGLLPQPTKPKSNVHLYDESCVEIIGLIKYLQKHFGTSITELKKIMAEGKFDFSKGFEAILESLDAIMGGDDKEALGIEEVARRLGIEASKLHGYIDRGLLFPRDGLLSGKELEIIEILLELEQRKIDEKILIAYTKQARELAKLEVEIVQELTALQSDATQTIKALLDTTLILKPYIYNMHTLRQYQKEIK
jgi:DNA-binding transcriptional MerR regulator